MNNGENHKVNHLNMGKPMNRCLGIDPGGVRMGWAVVGNPHDHFEPKYIASGVHGLVRGKEEDFQPYKLRLVKLFAAKADSTIIDYLPVVIVNEIIPAVGGGNFIAATQSELAKVSAIIYQAAGYASGLKVAQLGATTIKKVVAKNGKASKVTVRNAVIEFFPELAHRKQAWQAGKEGFDESDAVAICLAYWLTKKFL